MADTTGFPGSLPTPFTSFVGRRMEVAEVRRLLGASRLVTLTGAGGVGKTRLALEVAAGSVRAFSDGVWLVDLAPVRESSAVPGVVADALGVADVGTRPVAELLAAHLSDRRALVVLDNCEHLVDECAPLVQQLLFVAPELRILATSRETLCVTGEHVLAVAPLPQADAAELLRQRTAAVRPGFEVAEANQAVAARLCADLDGLPLAIELAATRLRSLTVEQVVQRLEDRFALLSAGSRTARPHQQTLRAAIDWSWELCSPQEQLLWSRLSVFAGSFTLDAAEGICCAEGIAAAEVVDLLDRLVAQSLVEQPEGEETPRYRMLETLRQYGQEQLAASGEEQWMRRRHRDFFLAMAERLYQDWFGPRQALILTRLRAEHANLLAALAYRDGIAEAPPGAATSGPAQAQPCAAAPCGDGQVALAGALIYHWAAGGYLGEGRRQLERALAAAPEPTPARARALVAAAHLAQTQYDLAAAGRWLDEADDLAERFGEPVVRAHVRGHQGVSALYAGRLDDALSLVERAVDAHTALGDRFGEVTWRCALALVQVLGGHPQALETTAEALTDAEAHGERWARAHLLMVLGRRAWALGDQDEAKALTISSLELLQGFSDTVGVAKMVEQLAWITASAGDHPPAARLLGAARSLREAAGITVASGDPRDEDHHARCETEASQALGRAEYHKALADGAAIDGPAQAIAYALAPATATATATGTEPAATPAAASPLTGREEQIAALVAQGMTSRKIAAELVLSPRTVDNHVNRILTKLGFSSRAQIAAWWTAQ